LDIYAFAKASDMAPRATRGNVSESFVNDALTISVNDPFICKARLRKWRRWNVKWSSDVWSVHMKHTDYCIIKRERMSFSKWPEREKKIHPSLQKAFITYSVCVCVVQRCPHETVNQTPPQQTKHPGSGSFIFSTFLSISASFFLLPRMFSQAITKVIYTCTVIQLFHTNSFHKAQNNTQMKQTREITITWRPGLHTKLRVYDAALSIREALHTVV